MKNLNRTVINLKALTKQDLKPVYAPVETKKVARKPITEPKKKTKKGSGDELDDFLTLSDKDIDELL